MNLKEIKRSTKYGLGITLYSLVMVALFYKYDKGAANCEWWNIHIYWWSLVAALLTVSGMVFWRAYQDMIGRASLRLFLLPIIGGIICFAMGAIWQEDKTEVTPVKVAQTEVYQESGNTTNNYYYYDSPRNRTGSSGIGETIGEILGGVADSGDGESGGEALVFLVLLIAIVLLALGSAFIPHFWVMAMVVNLTIMLVFFIREHDFEQGRAFSLFYKG